MDPSRVVRLALMLGLLALGSGCVVSVEMTSTPDSVIGGEPVTFNFKITNFSQCPVKEAGVELIAFIPESNFNLQLFGFSDLPSDIPPELQAFLDELRAFFDELCTGGTPDFPTIPFSSMSMSCARDGDDALCSFSGPVPAHEGNSGSMTFSGLGDRLRCEMDGSTVSCQLRLPLPQSAGGASGGGALATQSLECVDLSQFSTDVPGAICVVGSLQNPGGLDPGQMATGEISLPAQGEGFVRNLAIGFAGFGSSIGVCKGGANAGQACTEVDEQNDCPGSVCGEGICDGGDSAGEGCDESSEATDCPNGGNCVDCSDVPDTGFLPLDCTTTYIAPQTVPAMSTWGVAALAALLFAGGTLYLRRRARRA